MSKLAPQCVCTGCDFFDPLGGRVVHGDLHHVGASYVFNSCVNAKGEAAWEYKPADNGDRVVCANDYFERRGVIVFSAEGADMNDAMTRYVQPRHRPYALLDPE
jgi:hypothetical protein